MANQEDQASDADQAAAEKRNIEIAKNKAQGAKETNDNAAKDAITAAECQVTKFASRTRPKKQSKKKMNSSLQTQTQTNNRGCILIKTWIP